MPEPTTVTIENYPDRFLSCRTINHPWREEGLPWVEVKSLNGVEVQVVYEKFVCSRCDHERIDQRTMQGRLLRRGYRSNVGYRLPPDLRNGEALHAERINRLLSRAERSA